jgi:LysM repeat protein
MTQVKAASKKHDRKDKADKKEASVVVAVEKPKSEPERNGRTYRYSLSREMYSQNDVPFVYAYEGEKYSDIARQHGLFLGEILSYNDVSVDCELPKGAVVYLQAKKRKAAKGYDFYVVEEGMDMQDISQKFAVKLKRLYRMNKLEADYEPQVGDTIRLR